jgi:urease accessory protein
MSPRDTSFEETAWWRNIPELAGCHDEPAQLPTGSPGKDAYLRLGFATRGRKSCLVDLERRAPLIVQQALYWDEAMPDLPCVYIISNAGGVLQGDRYTIEIDLAEGSQAHITTQSATKLHEMDANFAAQSQKIVLREGAYLEYLPEPVIPHKGTRFVSRTEISIAEGATLLYSEILMPGRKYYEQGELFEYDLYSSLLRAERPGGRELFAERLVGAPKQRSMRRNGVMEHFDVLATVVLLSPKESSERIFERVPAVVNREENWAAGASRLPNEAGLIYKVLGMESQPVRAKVREFWSVVREVVVGHRLMPEFAWR